MALSPGVALAERRVALVIGNSKYETVPQLPNPTRDANAVAKMFKDAGFDSVDVQTDLGNLDFKRAVRKFEAESDQADIAVIFYAGHGIEIGGTNYIIPTDARLASDRDAEDEAVPLERVVSSADGAKKLRIIILDACRDNPFTVKMRRERRTASRAAVSSGLGKVEPTSTDTLIAYAAKAGSTAEDGEGSHSPFTTALLKNLTVPGLDIRLAFGRIRDEVMKSTGARQEPFVYGSLGGGNISLVPAPKIEQEAPSADIKADYELVAKINSRRAWEVFLGTYKTGFYADLARAQLASLGDQVPLQPAAPAPGNVAIAAVPPETLAPGRAPSSAESLDWDKIKDGSDLAAFRAFIRKYPNSPLAITAKQRLDLLENAAREREEARKAAEKAAEQERIEAERQKKREDEARKAAEAEAARKAAEEARIEAERKKAELAAQKEREDDERRAAEAERRAAEARAKAEEAARKKAEADAARQRAENERQAKQAEEQRKKAEAEAERLRVESERQAKQAEEERRKAELALKLEAACRQEEDRLKAITAKGSEGTGLDDIKAFAKDVTCDRVKPQVALTLDRFNTEVAKRLAPPSNTPELIRSAQTELARIGCFAGTVDGKLTAATRVSFASYQKVKKQKPSDDVAITGDVVAALGKETGRVCPLECKDGEIAKGDVCVAKPAPATASRGKDEDDDRRKPPAKKQVQREEPRRKQQAAQEPRKPQPAPQARQQASGSSRPSGGGSTMIGVGF